MRAVIQKVKSSKVTVNNEIISEISNGFNILLGISKNDTEEDIKYLKDKIPNLRIFEDEEGKLNKSLKEVNGEALVISQFTLYGDSRKGRRPSFIEALGGEEAVKLYNTFIEELKKEIPIVKTGEFGADMEVTIINDGPVTILLDSKKIF